MPRLSRRALLSVLAASAASSARAANPILRLGGPIFLKSDDPAELAQEHRRIGYSAAVCPPATIEDTARLKAIEAAYKKADVVLAEVGVWLNMLDRDPVQREANIKRVTTGLAVADAVGARCCVDIAGSMNPTVWYGPHPENVSQQFFDATVENCRRVIDAVKPTRAKFALEMMGWSLPDSPENYVKLLKAVDRPSFGVHVDICNLVNSPTRYYNNTALTDDCFRQLGKWIVSCHAKDLAWPAEMNVHFVEVVPGRGGIDYRAYLRQIGRLPGGVPLLLEHLKTPEDYAEGRRFIATKAQEVGLSLI